MSSPKSAKKRSRRYFSAQQKCEAILCLWTEKKSQSEICKELKVSSLTLQRWQDQAMAAILKALEPKRKKNEGSSLSPRLEKLLSRQLQPPPNKEESSPSSPPKEK